MAKRVTMTMNIVLVAAVSMMLMTCIDSETYTVGGTDGWTIPPSLDFYDSWAAGYKFAVGDTLVFDFGSNHDVANVSKDGYDQCSFGNVTPNRNSPVEFPLTEEGNYYFVCTTANHCPSGQKLAVTVGDAVDAANPPPNTTPSASPPPQKDSGAMTLINFTLCASFLALVVAFLY